MDVVTAEPRCRPRRSAVGNRCRSERAAANDLRQAAGPDAVEQAVQRAADADDSGPRSGLALQRQKLPRLFEGGTPFGVFFGVWAIAAVPCALVIGWQNWIWVAASLAIAVAATGGLLGVAVADCARAKRPAVSEDSAAVGRCAARIESRAGSGPRAGRTRGAGARQPSATSI